jgi:hypothetical protein
MNNVELESNFVTIEKYKTLIMMISRTEDRLRLSEIAYLSLNIIVLLFAIAFVSHLFHKAGSAPIYIDYALAFLNLIIGMSINIYWVAFAMRVQLKLKLRYFQARYIERKLGRPDENIFSGDHIFFDPDIRRLDSPDGHETLTFPTEGLKKMDGAVGSLKVRYFSWLLPCLFIVIYWVIFFLLVTTV